MTREKFLTVSWNNLLSLGLGVPTLIYVVYAISNSVWSTRGGLIGLAAIGVLYWLIIEGHTAMRFAWLRKNLINDVSIKQVFSLPITLIRIAYNAAFWIFLVPFFTTIDYSIGFIAFTVIILVRLSANLYANHVLKQPEQFESYPFRAWTFEW